MHMDAEQLIEKYAIGEEICEGLKFDFSMLLGAGAPNLWAVRTLTDHAIVTEFYTKLGELGG